MREWLAALGGGFLGLLSVFRNLARRPRVDLYVAIVAAPQELEKMRAQLAEAIETPGHCLVTHIRIGPHPYGWDLPVTITCKAALPEPAGAPEGAESADAQEVSDAG